MMKKNWKNRFVGYVAVALAGIMIGSGAMLAAHPVAQAENTTTTVVTSPFTDAVSKVHDSVVGISNYQTVRYSTYGGNGFGSFFGYGFGGNGRGNSGSVQEQEVEAATGSGVVVGANGYVLTNYHVVEDASSLKVTVGDDAYDATLVAYDENLDIAIVQAKELKLAPVTLGDSDSLQVGDWAICIGNPLGEQFSGTVTVGVVSALNRAVSSSSTDKYGRKETIVNNMIQTDAAINNGNSGGGMFNVNGELMGIPTLKYSGSAYSGATVEGIGMCIPINAAKPLIEDVLSGKVSSVSTNQSGSNNGGVTMEGRPRMGISTTNMNTSHSALVNGELPNGAYVANVEQNGPAEKAGMQVGDIIVDVDGTVITSSSQLQSIVYGHSAGDTLNVKVYRVPGLADLGANDEIPDGEYVDLTITLALVDETNQ